MSEKRLNSQHPSGPRCGKCRITEARCAWSYPCCENCSHFQATKPVERPPKEGTIKAAPKPESPEPYEWQYEWYVAETGTAHAHITPRARSTCGKIVGTFTDPVETWVPVCKACLRHVA